MASTAENTMAACAEWLTTLTGKTVNPNVSAIIESINGISQPAITRNILTSNGATAYTLTTVASSNRPIPAYSFANKKSITKMDTVTTSRRPLAFAIDKITSTAFSFKQAVYWS